jgi:hypothetical protein
VLLQEIADPADSVFREDFEQAGDLDFQWMPVAPEGITDDLLRQRLGSPDRWLFFIQAEGAECKRLSAAVKALGVDPKQIFKERWS